MAISYWLVPQLTGRKLKFKTLALIQPYAWFLGMTLMSNAMHRAGLAGVPRRTAEPEFNTNSMTFEPIFGTMGEMNWQIAIGGTILTISLVLFLWVIVGTWMAGEKSSKPVDDFIPKPLSGSDETPAILDNMKLWFALALIIVILAYTFPLFEMVQDGIFSPGALPRPS
jgi:cytochrome c oxidase subunit 1